MILRGFFPSLLVVAGVTLTTLACQNDAPATSQPSTPSSQPVEPGSSPSTAYYQEPHRPQVHFSPEKAWMNDPNGLFYLNGTYHLYYQYNPDSTVWGPMHWGHATSIDLIKWDHQPIALEPDSIGTIFSGSIVVDKENTSGLGPAGSTPVVAIYTQHNHAGEDAKRNDFQNQSIAYSLDEGYTWQKYEGNPVLPNPGRRDFRDPKVFWHDGSSQWVMSLAATDEVQFYTSPDLKSWNYASSFGKGIALGTEKGVWECPDLFPLRHFASSKLNYCLLVSVNPGGVQGGSAVGYFIGTFDGKRFTPLPEYREPKWLDHGSDNYALVTFSNSPTPANRTLAIGWMSNWSYAQTVPTSTWRSAMTLTRTLSLHQTEDGLLLKNEMVPDLFRYRGERLRFNRISDLVPTNLFTTAQDWRSRAFEIDLNTPNGEVKDFVFTLASKGGDTLSFGYDAGADEYFIDRTKLHSSSTWSDSFAERHTMPRKSFSTAQILRIVVDRSSVELFADDGFSTMTDLFFLEGALSSFTLDGAAGISGTLYELTEVLPTPESVARVRLGLDD